ncbi:hypothetical protein ACI2J9_16930 [Pseudomonas fulva]|uniref:hypothetical protein n=1 Tax=Pseudomonas fulva TaxID=47880 RepID=UPI00384F5D00
MQVIAQAAAAQHHTTGMRFYRQCHTVLQRLYPYDSSFTRDDERMVLVGQHMLLHQTGGSMYDEMGLRHWQFHSD